MNSILARWLSLDVLIALMLLKSINCDKGDSNGNDNSVGSEVNLRKSSDFIYNGSNAGLAAYTTTTITGPRGIGTGGGSEGISPNPERVLSRQRRYLTFPEGSSLQVVFDQIIPIVDYNNYLILGITVALAWELPSKAPSEMLEDIRDKLNDGTLGLQRKDEKVETLEYTDSAKNKTQNELPKFYSSPYTNNFRYKWNPNNFHPPMNYNLFYNRKFNRPVYPNQYFPHNNNHGYSWRRHYDQAKFNGYNYTQHNWKHEFDRIWNAGNRRRRPIHSGNDDGYKVKAVRKHRIYPVFGKRSTDSQYLSSEERFHLRYHRSSRHGLYMKIEKYLHTQGKNGFECVLKTLCETGQKRHEEEPSSFVGEIMRAIFTIPESFEPVASDKHRKYDEAHSHKGDCSERYPSCPESLWNSEFIF